MMLLSLIYSTGDLGNPTESFVALQHFHTDLLLFFYSAGLQRCKEPPPNEKACVGIQIDFA